MRPQKVTAPDNKFLKVRFICNNRHTYSFCVIHISSFLSGSLGGIDDSLILRFLQAENRSLTDVYVRDSGLYLLPSSVTAEGSVETMCIFGHFNARFVSHIVNEDGDVDLQTGTRPFVYVLHYRPLNEDPTTYRMVNKPALVYHGPAKGCVSESDGLDWQVQRGDKIGVFIPDNCSSWDQLRASTAFDVFSTQFGIDLLCPSQINLAVDERLRRDSSLCKYAYYLKCFSIGYICNQVRAVYSGRNSP